VPADDEIGGARESVVFIVSRAKLLVAKSLLVSWRAACVGAAALMLSAVTLAYADELYVGGCVGAGGGGGGSGSGAFSCVLRVGPAGHPYIRTVPQPQTEADKARQAERDHRWVERCRPVVGQDRYGVPRYHYAAPGCDFGVVN
jgi:hypothetical protein